MDIACLCSSLQSAQTLIGTVAVTRNPYAHCTAPVYACPCFAVLLRYAGEPEGPLATPEWVKEYVRDMRDSMREMLKTRGR